MARLPWRLAQWEHWLPRAGRVGIELLARRGHGLEERFAIVHLHALGASDGDGLQLLRAHDGADTGPPGRPVAVVDDAGVAHAHLAGGKRGDLAGAELGLVQEALDAAEADVHLREVVDGEREEKEREADDLDQRDAGKHGRGGHHDREPSQLIIHQESAPRPIRQQSRRQ